MIMRRLAILGAGLLTGGGLMFGLLGPAAQAATVSPAVAIRTVTAVAPEYPPPADEGYTYSGQAYENQAACIGIGVGGILIGSWVNYWCWQNPSTGLYELWTRDY